MKSNKPLRVSLIIMLLITMTAVKMVTMINVTSASPATYIYGTPAVITGKVIGNTFPVDIYVNEAPSTCAWGVSVSWDPNLLSLMWLQEGNFLNRDMYATTLYSYPVVPPWDEANVKGEIIVACSLASPFDPWATGNGWLFKLGFEVKATGSTLINLFDTVLLDHYVGPSPAPTPYPNNDSLFYNVSPSHDISGRARYIKLLHPSVYVGEVAKINVTVLNEGTVDESITLNVYANDTLIGTTGLSLNGTGNFENRSSTYTVAWNTVGFPVGRYNISAYVPPVPDEVDTADNDFMGEQQVMVLLTSDINRDGSVDNDDLAPLAQAYGSIHSSPNWNSDTDLNEDDVINVVDLFLLAKDYGKKI